MILKLGSTGEYVKILQELLGIQPVDGIFGNQTKGSVASFQRRNKIPSDGIVGARTWKALEYNPIEYSLDTDRQSYGNWIETYHLSEGQYVKDPTSKQYIVLHHTAGRENPYKVIDHWASDNRGRVGTNYVIGGVSIDGRNDQYDGKILRAIDDEYYGWHIGYGSTMHLKRHSLSIEICSAGGLEERNGRWYTWFGALVEESQVCILKKPFRGYRAFHRYSNEQLKSLKALLKYLSETHGINLKIGMQDWINKGVNAFDLNLPATEGRINGLLNHTNFRKDKSDIFPQPEVIELIKNL